MRKESQTSHRRRALIAGAAGMLMGAPFALLPMAARSAAYGSEPAARHPQQMLQQIVDRETQVIGVDGTGGSTVVPVAGETYVQPTQMPQSGGVSPVQQHYNSEVQRQLQLLYQQDGRPMPQMMMPPTASPGPMPPAQPTSGRVRLKELLEPSEWMRRWTRKPNRSRQPAEEVSEFGEPAPLTQTAVPPPVVTPAPAPVPAPRPQLQRYSPEIFSVDAAPQPVQAPAVPTSLPAVPSSLSAEQPRLFPGAIQSTPTVTAVPPTVEAPAETPLLIILPETQQPEAALPAAPAPFAANSEPLEFETVTAEPAPLGLPALEATLTVPSSPAAEFPFFNEDPDTNPQESPLLTTPEPTTGEQGSPFTGLQLETQPYATLPTPPLAAPSNSSSGPSNVPLLTAPASQPATVNPLPTTPVQGPALTAPGDSAAPATLPLVQPGRPLQSVAAPAATPQPSSAQEKLARIAAREGLTGFKGFCPVMLRDHRELVDAKMEFTAIYQGQQYWFASAEAKQLFLVNPGAYVPASGGIDVVQHQRTGESRDGLLDYAVWYRGRLYLFTSAENKAEFVASPRLHAATE